MVSDWALNVLDDELQKFDNCQVNIMPEEGFCAVNRATRQEVKQPGQIARVASLLFRQGCMQCTHVRDVLVARA